MPIFNLLFIQKLTLARSIYFSLFHHLSNILTMTIIINILIAKYDQKVDLNWMAEGNLCPFHVLVLFLSHLILHRLLQVAFGCKSYQYHSKYFIY